MLKRFYLITLFKNLIFSLIIYIFREDPWRRAWQLTSVFSPGESPQLEEPAGLQSMGRQRVLQDWGKKHTGLSRCSESLPGPPWALHTPVPKAGPGSQVPTARSGDRPWAAAPRQSEQSQGRVLRGRAVFTRFFSRLGWRNSHPHQPSLGSDFFF